MYHMDLVIVVNIILCITKLNHLHTDNDKNKNFIVSIILWTKIKYTHNSSCFNNILHSSNYSHLTILSILTSKWRI